MTLLTYLSPTSPGGRQTSAGVFSFPRHQPSKAQESIFRTFKHETPPPNHAIDPPASPHVPVETWKAPAIDNQEYQIIVHVEVRQGRPLGVAA